MSFLDWILGTQPRAVSPGRTTAETIMRGLNPHALCGIEGAEIVFIEDHADPDSRLYRLEYRSNPGGTQATAWCRYLPWPPRSYGIHQCHLFGSGQICIGGPSTDLRAIVLRARFWTTCYSYLREHDSWPDEGR